MFCKKHKTEDAGQSKYTEEDIDSEDNDGHDKRDQADALEAAAAQQSGGNTQVQSRQLCLGFDDI